ncbi:MAG TPA: hypothetical protein DF383_13045, partial [Deltaproteobacteria bacterium]|nr:hypothetical protein [Deltaproteobacteria bacterium]
MLEYLPPNLVKELGAAVGLTPESFGRSLGKIFQRRSEEIYRKLGFLSEMPPRFEKLSVELQEAVEAADKIIDVIEYYRRSKQTDILSAFSTALHAKTWESFEALKKILIHILGPHFDAPSGDIARGTEVLQPDQAVYFIGSGDATMGLAALYRHNIKPGTHSWRTRLLAAARKQDVADPLNENGHYKNKTGDQNIQINYRHDPRLIALGPEGYQGITQQRAASLARLQLLNVPSKKLYEVLTPEYIRNLPENAVLTHVIGGLPKNVIWVEGKDGKLEELGPEAGQPEVVLPYQLIRRALDQHGRSDVRIVHGSGYIPGKKLRQGDKDVRMIFAGETIEAARLVAEAFAGKEMKNTFVSVGVSDQIHSSELGKFMKNVTTLMAGYEAVKFALNKKIEDDKLQGHYKTETRDSLWSLMLDVLRKNESRDEVYVSTVKDDYDNCSAIDMLKVRNVVNAAKQVDIHDERKMKSFLIDS